MISNLAICWLTPFFSSMQLIVTGRVAELEPVPKAVIKALKEGLIYFRQYMYISVHHKNNKGSDQSAERVNDIF